MKLNYNPWLKVNYLFLCFAYLFRLSHGTDRITANYSISGDQIIVSQPEGIFELGFFNPSGNSSKYYIGIWYKKISLQTVVWVANRENPVIDKHSCELKIMNGNLVLTNGSKSPVWSSNLTSTKSDSINAVLLDSGNLVIRDGSERNQKPLWQSFDEPTNTWLPGGKLIYDKRGRKPQRLISWKNQDDPARGLFSLELVPTTKEYVIKWNLTRQFWTSGAWDDQERIFSLVPEMRLNYIYNFSYIDNSNESYFTYSVYHSSIISRFVMDISGQVKQLTWLEETQQWNLFWSNPKQQCQVYAYCGAFGSCNQNSLPFCTCLKGFKPKSEGDWGLSDYSRGCERKTDLQCERPNSQKKRDRFFPYNNLVLPQNDTKLNAGTIEECEAACSKNCSCYAYAYDGSGCSAWHEDLLNIQQLSDGDTSGKTLYLRLAASEFTKKKNKNLVIGVVVGSIIVTLALFCLVFGLLWRRKNRSVGSSNKGVEGSLISFGYRELQHATKNFSDKLGGGGFGSVFKGILPDSSVIAVKKLESFSQGEKQFRTEVSTIGTIQHVNLVRLRGFCSEGTKKLLVYDYMPNGSLEAHLFPEKSSNLLDWKTRYQIALGTARGLAYLHEKCRDCIIHCDIKPENILLDAEFCPKVADFGLAKLVGRDFSRVLTTMRGTRGYLAPEWISGVAITAKADVFSYGMMLFELISGHRNTEQSVYGTVKFFPTWAASKVAEGAEIMSILDPRLEGNADEEEVKKICKLACWCIQDNEIQRPSMGQVVQIIEGVLDVNMPPMPRSLQVFVEEQDNIMFYTESSSAQSSQTRNTSSSAQSSQTRNTSSSAQSSQTRNTPTASSSSISKNSVSTMSNNNAVE